MAIVGYTGAGDTDDTTSGSNGIIIGRGLRSALPGDSIYSLMVRAGHSANGQWAAMIYDEAGDLKAATFAGFFGDIPIDVQTFVFGAHTLTFGDTYFYFALQWLTDVGKFRYESSVDEYFYYGNQVAYGDLTLDPAPSDNRTGTPCMWVNTGPVPVISVAPVASGAPEVGAVLSCNTGTWTNTPTSYAYQWYADDILLPGETNTTYTVVIGDLGTQINCHVVASNDDGDGLESPSNYIGPITTPTGDPTIVTYPVVTGASNILGVSLTTTNGTWLGVPTSFTYQWFRDCGGGGILIPGETANIYTTVVGDVGCYLYCEVTAYN